MKVFVDMDGVVADFDKSAREILGMTAREHEEQFGRAEMFALLYKKPHFFLELDPMPDANQLIEGIIKLGYIPEFLTAAPSLDTFDMKSAPWEKRTWAKQRWPDLHCTVTKSADKWLACNPGDVIIDDWPKYMNKWENLGGGKFIIHKNASDSLQQLEDYILER